MSTHWLITDAWGQHRSLVPLLDRLTTLAPWRVIDPYCGQPFIFNDDEQAQQYFNQRAGLDSYSEQLITLLQKAKQPLTILAIGEGADALWPLLSGPLATSISQAVLLDCTVITSNAAAPNCPVAFVQSQPCEPALAEQLQGWGAMYLTQAKQGFFNPRSDNYVYHAACEAQAWLLQQLN